MIKLTVDIPIEVGNKVYQTTSKCDVVEGIVSDIFVSARYNDRQLALIKLNNPAIDITITVRWPNGIVSYDVCDLDKAIFTSKEGLIKHLVNLL